MRLYLKISGKKSSTFFREFKMNFRFFFIFCTEFCIFSADIWWSFVRISRQIQEKSDVCRFFNQICENRLEIYRKLWILWKLFTIIQNYSLVSLRVPGEAAEHDVRRRLREPLRLVHAVPRSRHLSWKVRSARDRAKRTIPIRVRSAFFQNSGIFARKFKKFRKITVNIF